MPRSQSFLLNTNEVPSSTVCAEGNIEFPWYPIFSWSCHSDFVHTITCFFLLSIFKCCVLLLFQRILDYNFVILSHTFYCAQYILNVRIYRYTFTSFFRICPSSYEQFVIISVAQNFGCLHVVCFSKVFVYCLACLYFYLGHIYL